MPTTTPGEAQPALPMINFPMANDRHDGEDGDDDHACNGRDQRNYHKGTIWMILTFLTG